MIWAEGKFGKFVNFLGSQFLFIFAPLDTLLSMEARAHSFIHSYRTLLFLTKLPDMHACLLTHLLLRVTPKGSQWTENTNIAIHCAWV